jgi:hypothetical protein
MTIDASVAPRPMEPLPFSIGGRSPAGRVLSANTRFLTLDGTPWFPLMGEFHYSRYPRTEWEREILKTRAGGINVISSYVFWLHHEETEAIFDWTGQRDLRGFVKLCAEHGLYVWLRIGPWVHSEARNGGLPEWLVQSRIPLRQNDPSYLSRVKRFYSEIAGQVRGLFWADGGPIIGIQLENEYHPENGGIEHMRRLRELAIKTGLLAPYYSATGWDGAAVPPTDFLPVFSAYPEQFWSGSMTELPPNQNFFFSPIRAEDNVASDFTPRDPIYQSRYEGFPFLMAEMGAGMSTAYHRRPIMTADDSAAVAVVKLGSGANGFGYYMYHGGTNPPGRTPLQETQATWNGYNDMETKSYDWQSPVGEFGQLRPSYRTLKILHLFLEDYGTKLAPMVPHFPIQRPADRNDNTRPRIAARTDDKGGFVFINNYQRNYPLGPKADLQISVQLPRAIVTMPRRPTTIPDGAYVIWPINFDVGDATLRYSTAQLLCRLNEPDTLVFFAWPGIEPEFAFEQGTQVEALRARVTREKSGIFVDGIETGTDVAMRIIHREAPATEIVVLQRDQALNLWKARIAGRERLVLSPAGLSFDRNRINVTSRAAADLTLAVFPRLDPPVSNFREDGADGIFQCLVSRAPITTAPVSAEEHFVREASPSVPVKLSAPPRAVAMEPVDADFERAAVWKVRVPWDISGRVFLQIDYEGNAARMYAGDRFDNDNFFKGMPWELGLWRYSNEELKAGLELRILPLRRDAPVFLERHLRPNFAQQIGIVRLKAVNVSREFETTLELAPQR